MFRTKPTSLILAAPILLLAGLTLSASPIYEYAVIARPGDAFSAMRNLILSNDSTFAAKRGQVRGKVGVGNGSIPWHRRRGGAFDGGGGG